MRVGFGGLGGGGKPGIGDGMPRFYTHPKKGVMNQSLFVTAKKGVPHFE